MLLKKISRDVPFQWIFYWLLIPNITIVVMWPFGGPPMHPILVVYGFVALFVSQMPWLYVRRIGSGILFLWISSYYIASAFMIPTLNGSMFLQFLADVRPFRAPEYILAATVLVALLLITMWRAPLVKRFGRAQYFAIAGLSVFGFNALDVAVNAHGKESYRALPSSGATFSSAVKQAGLSAADPQRHHLIIIVVEALGVPLGQVEKQLFNDAWDRKEWADRFDVKHGETPFFGSTTSGELRELCGVWSDYIRFDFDHADCLPKKFIDAGYETTAIHSFSGGMFNRTAWYPKLGFQKISFGDDLEREGARPCGGVFPGACDKDVPDIIRRKLEAAKKPQFIYWLTLNSHLPVVASESDGTARCELGSSAWRADFPRVCRMEQKHKEVADAISRLILSPSLKNTDILIVGDHRPPFVDRGSRQHFADGAVPWIFLRSRSMK